MSTEALHDIYWHACGNWLRLSSTYSFGNTIQPAKIPLRKENLPQRDKKHPEPPGHIVDPLGCIQRMSVKTRHFFPASAVDYMHAKYLPIPLPSPTVVLPSLTF